MLTKNEMEIFLGGGWVSLPNGTVIFIPDGDEEDEGAEFFFG